MSKKAEGNHDANSGNIGGVYGIYGELISIVCGCTSLGGDVTSLGGEVTDLGCDT